jgi:hypothetical protein
MSESNYLKPSIDFNSVELIYHNISLAENSPYLTPVSHFKLYRAYISEAAPPIYIYDTKDIMHGSSSSYPIITANINDLIDTTDTKEQKYILKRIKETDNRIENITDLKGKLFIPNYKFNDEKIVDYIEGMKPSKKWKDFVHDIIAYKCEKDEAIFAVNKATMLRGINMMYSPHTLMSTNVATGKSTFYENIGHRLDRNTKHTLLPSAKWTNDRYRGFLHGKSLPVCLEEIESQEIENVLGLLFTYMESGKAKTAAGGAEMQAEGTSPIIVTGNPVGYNSNRLQSFKDLLAALAKNTVGMGRRFGIVVFGVDYHPIKNVGIDDTEHKKLIAVFRAIEERSYQAIEGLYINKKVLDWLNTPIEGYDSSILAEMKIQDPTVSGFLENQINMGYKHLRGGALSMTLVDYLPVIASSEILSLPLTDPFIDTLLTNANENLKQLVAINKDSIGHLSQNE